MKTYRMEDLLGLTIYAAADVPVKGFPEDAASVIRMIPKGQPVGVLHAWLDPKAGRSQMYFIFKDSQGQSYYTPYEAGLYDSGTVDRQIEQKKKDPWWKDVFSGSSRIAQTGIFIAAGAFILYKAVK